MKRFPLAFFLVIFALAAQAQNTQPGCFPYPKTISVSGSAEMNVIPDEIYVEVTLREYKKKGENKTELDKIKTDFLATCKAVGIADSNISVTSFEGYNMASITRRRRKDPDLFSSIEYQLKFSNTRKIDELTDKLDDEATEKFQVTRTSHSKMTEYRKQLKIQAVKAAKEKANYLAESVNEQVGPAITIVEPEENVGMAVNNLRSQNIVNYSRELKDKDDDNGTDYTKIRLRYSVKIIYALK